MKVYSIGYATKDIDVFISQLQQYSINAVADIRSVPYSKVFYDYHQEALKQTLNKSNIAYAYLGDELGPRSKNPDHYDDSDQVQFDRLMRSDMFAQGVDRIKAGVQKGYTMALTCAEKEPAVCHRSLLVGWALLHHHDIDVLHIHYDGSEEAQSKLELRLMPLTDTEQDMLTSFDEACNLAYKKQCKRYAYARPE